MTLTRSSCMTWRRCGYHLEPAWSTADEDRQRVFGSKQKAMAVVMVQSVAKVQAVVVMVQALLMVQAVLMAADAARRGVLLMSVLAVTPQDDGSDGDSGQEAMAVAEVAKRMAAMAMEARIGGKSVWRRCFHGLISLQPSRC